MQTLPAEILEATHLAGENYQMPDGGTRLHLVGEALTGPKGIPVRPRGGRLARLYAKAGPMLKAEVLESVIEYLGFHGSDDAGPINLDLVGIQWRYARGIGTGKNTVRGCGFRNLGIAIQAGDPNDPDGKKNCDNVLYEKPHIDRCAIGFDQTHSQCVGHDFESPHLTRTSVGFNLRAGGGVGVQDFNVRELSTLVQWHAGGGVTRIDRGHFDRSKEGPGCTLLSQVNPGPMKASVTAVNWPSWSWTDQPALMLHEGCMVVLRECYLPPHHGLHIGKGTGKYGPAKVLFDGCMLPKSFDVEDFCVGRTTWGPHSVKFRDCFRERGGWYENELNG